MSGDLQATLEISVELSTFHNVDLFQRGYYQIRCSLKPPEKSVSCIDVEYKRTNGDYQPDDCIYPALVTATGLTAVSKTFQILYKNEEVILADPFIFRLNMLVDSNKLTDQIDQADIHLLVELYFSDSEVGPECPDSLASVSSQTLKLHLSSIKGLHHHIPILFDYFHFAVVDTTIHAVLVKLSLPDPSILKIPKSSWFSKSSANTRVPTPLFYVKLFGNKPISNVLSTRTSAEERQIRFAYDTHRSLCSTLLSVQVNLLAYFECLSEFLPESQKIQIDSLDFGQRLDSLFVSIESIQNANEVFSQICSDLDSISMELSLVWSQFLESFTLNKQVLPHFRDEHHRQRIGHFSEAFFVEEFSWDELQIYQEQSYQMHQSLGQGIKNSRYYQTIPVVVVECPNLDGDTSSTPIIFEDKYLFKSMQQAECDDSDLEKISLSVDVDGFESKKAGEDDILAIETDMNDVPASKDDPNSSFPLSGIMCNGEGPVRETMILDDETDDGTSDLSMALQEILLSQHKNEPSTVPSSNKEDERSQQDCRDSCSVCDNVSECGHEDLCNSGHLSETFHECNASSLETSSECGKISEHKTIDSKKCDDLQKCSGDKMTSRDDLSKLYDARKIEVDADEISMKLLMTQGNDQNLKDGNVELSMAKIADEGKSIENQDKILEQEIVIVKSKKSSEELSCESKDQKRSIWGFESNGSKILDKYNDDSKSDQIGFDEAQIQEEGTINNDQESSGKENEANSPQTTLNNTEMNERQSQKEPNEKEDIFYEQAMNEIERIEEQHHEIQIDVEANQEKQKEMQEVGEVSCENTEEDDKGTEDKETKDTELQELPQQGDDDLAIQGGQLELLPLQEVNEHALSESHEKTVLELDVGNASDKERGECKDNAKESMICNDKSDKLDIEETKIVSRKPTTEETKEKNVSISEETEDQMKVSVLQETKDQEILLPEEVKEEQISVLKNTKDQKASEHIKDQEIPIPEHIKDQEIPIPEHIKDQEIPIQEHIKDWETPIPEESKEEQVSIPEETKEQQISVVEGTKDQKIILAEETKMQQMSILEEKDEGQAKHDGLESIHLQNDEKPCEQIAILDNNHSTHSELKQSSSVVTFLSAQEDIASSGSPSHSVYQTPASSQTTFFTQSEVDGSIQRQQKQQQQDKKQAAQDNTNKKAKKKANQKGLMITGCLPVNCSGNTSPSFTRGNSIYGGSVKSRFELAKKYMKRQLKFSGQIYSDIGLTAEREPYFSKERVDGIDTHLIVCVHGLDGNSGDLRLFRCYLEMALPSTRIDFLMSEINQGDTFVSFEELTDRLVQEILHFIDAYSIFPSKISFVGHSLGTIIIRSALTHPSMQPLLDRMYTFLSLSGPHVGMLYPTSPLVSTGLWLMQKWKKSEALTQLSLNDHEDLRQTCIYRLSQSKGLEYFKHVLLVSSVQDHYVPYHSARIEMCKSASRDTSEYGTIYREMIKNLLSPLKDKDNMTFIRYSCYHALTSSANSFIGRAAHIAMLDSELFIEKLLLVSALDYFR